MSKIFFLLAALLVGATGVCQELSAPEGFYIGPREAKPSLSFLAPAVPSQKLTLREVNFNKEVKREVNLVAVMERERYERESSYIELESPLPNISRFEQGMIETTNDFRFHDRSSNYDIYTGEKKIPAYDEMRIPLFSSPFHTRGRARAYISPYTYSPFLR
jgi:hypothetical protein